MTDASTATPRRRRFLEPSGAGLVFACGTALFSDGYQNGVIGSVNTLIKRIYADDLAANQLKNYSTIFSSTGFAGTVVGMLVFGLLSDRIGRKMGMIYATLIVFVFAALSSGAFAGGSTIGMLRALAAYRFLGGIGIGAEYPSGSVAAAENTEDPAVSKTIQHGLFALATNTAIDFAFVVSAFVPLVMVWIFGENHLRVAWRMSLGLGVIPPLLVLFWRLRMAEPVAYTKYNMKRIPLAAYPWGFLFKTFGIRWAGLCFAWFIYDFISYPFGIYSSTVISTITGSSTALTTIFGWNVVINLFYMPGTIIGAFVVDKIHPKKLMIFALFMQAIFGFAMSGAYTYLTQHIAGFAVMYGIFLSWGELGPGNCLGLLASKSSPTAIRGMFYGTAAAVGKVGAFAGTWAFPAIIDDFPVGPRQETGPLWIGSGLAIASALTVLITISEVPADHMRTIDEAFVKALEVKGFDINGMGPSGQEGMSEHILVPGTKAVDLIAQEKALEKEEAVAATSEDMSDKQ